MGFTDYLDLPLIASNQNQKHITHNEAIVALDALVQLSVLDKDLSAPPLSPNDADRYLVGASATGDWAGQENSVAAWDADGSEWIFYTALRGWISWVVDESSLYVYDGSEWIVLTSAGLSQAGILDFLDDGTVKTLGINANADTTNRLSITTAAVLFNREVDDLQVKVNKQSATDTASFLFQTNFSARAEFGTTGDDDFHVKVSPDGSTFYDGLVTDKNSGNTNFPNGFSRNGVSSDTLNTQIYANSLITGPMALKFDGSNLDWTGRIMALGAGRGSHWGTGGYFEIRRPATGVVITGYGGASDVTVVADGIPMVVWTALYYKLPIGGPNSSVDANFRVVSYTSNFVIPDDEMWIMVAMKNGDTGELRFCNGETLYADTVPVDRLQDVRRRNLFPQFHVSHVSSWSSPGVVIFSDVAEDNGSNYSVTTGQFTAPKSGRYVFYSQILINPAAASGDVHIITFRKNGAVMTHGRSAYNQQDVASSYESLAGSVVVELAVGDTMEVHVSGTTIYLGDLTYFYGHMIATGE